MNELITINDQEREALRVIKEQMLSVVMYSEEWFKLKDRWQKLYKKKSKKREGDGK